MTRLRYGAAYYTEYMPCERLDEDIRMMKEAGINTVRIAESTWSTLEKQPGEFTFDHVDRVLDAMHAAGIDVIVGTPTYAIPSWMEKLHPEVMADTHQGRPRYGARQIMDIASPAYRFYAERAIRQLIGHVAKHPAVIGYQLDNETKYYDTAGENVRRGFVRYLKRKFGTTDALNAAFGLDYWSNRVDAWEDFPDPRGTINASLGAEFDKYRRGLVTEFLLWQRKIVDEYRRPDQFVTHNFDFEWRGHSYGIQPSVDHFAAAKALTVAGCDIYHPSQMQLTGAEIALGGDITRGLKDAPYLVLETEAQGFPQWTPFPGQLMLQAVSHIASGAEMVEYWHWHSIHNSFETYWKGLLSHDFAPNATYREAGQVGRLFERLSGELTGLHKRSRVAMLASNEALTAIEWFEIPGVGKYNDVLRWAYDALYRRSVGVDVRFPESMDYDRYDVIVVPALYAASEETLLALKRFVERGGHLLTTFKSAFCDEHVKVYADRQPHILGDALGAHYSQFTLADGVKLAGLGLSGADAEAQGFMELIEPDAGAQAWVKYVHPYWGEYAAVTHNRFGRGTATHVACFGTPGLMDAVLDAVLTEAGIADEGVRFPLIVRDSWNADGRRIRFVLNYSAEPQTWTADADGVNLADGRRIRAGEELTLKDWGFAILRGTESRTVERRACCCGEGAPQG